MKRPARSPGRHRFHVFEGTGPFPGFALAFVILGSVFLLAAALSPNTLQWTGQAARGTERGGILFYSYGGQTYTLDDPAASPAAAQTVFVDPSNPSNAMLDSPFDRWIDLLTIGGPYAAAALLLATGYLRRARNRHRRRTRERSFGDGLDPETVARLLEEQRSGKLRP